MIELYINAVNVIGVFNVTLIILVAVILLGYVIALLVNKGDTK